MQEPPLASITYSLTVEDMQAYYKWHNFTPEYRQKLGRYVHWQAFWFFAVAFLAGYFVLGFGEGEAFWGSVCLAVLVGFALYKHYLKKAVKSLDERANYDCKESENPGLVGQYTLEVQEDGFTVHSKYMRTHYLWGGITSIMSDETRTVLCVGTGSISLIPHDKITSGDLSMVLEKLKRYHRLSKNTSTL